MELWDTILREGWAEIVSLCANAAEEGQMLEFKRKEKSETNELTRDDRKSLGESLSALSNATGGVLLFGILDKKDDQGIDRADKPQPLDDAEAIANKIKTLVPEILSPPHSNIEVISVCEGAGSNRGIVAIRVGESNFRPHMSMAPDHKRYFVRAGASNRIMVDFQVRDMLRVQRSPMLRVGYQLRSGASTGLAGGTRYFSKLVLTLCNSGPVSAKQPYLLIREEPPLQILAVPSAQFETIDTSGIARYGVQATGTFTLHPGMEAGCIALCLGVVKQNGEYSFGMSEATETYTPFKDLKDLVIVVAFGCEDMPIREAKLVLTRKEIEALAEEMTTSRRVAQSVHRYQGEPQNPREGTR